MRKMEDVCRYAAFFFAPSSVCSQQAVCQGCCGNCLSNDSIWNTERLPLQPFKLIPLGFLREETYGFRRCRTRLSIEESSLNRLDFWCSLMDPSRGSAQELPRRLGAIVDEAAAPWQILQSMDNVDSCLKFAWIPSKTLIIVTCYE